MRDIARCISRLRERVAQSVRYCQGGRGGGGEERWRVVFNAFVEVAVARITRHPFRKLSMLYPFLFASLLPLAFSTFISSLHKTRFPPFLHLLRIDIQLFFEISIFVSSFARRLFLPSVSVLFANFIDDLFLFFFFLSSIYRFFVGYRFTCFSLFFLLSYTRIAREFPLSREYNGLKTKRATPWL